MCKIWMDSVHKRRNYFVPFGRCICPNRIIRTLSSCEYVPPQNRSTVMCRNWKHLYTHLLMLHWRQSFSPRSIRTLVHISFRLAGTIAPSSIQYLMDVQYLHCHRASTNSNNHQPVEYQHGSNEIKFCAPSSAVPDVHPYQLLYYQIMCTATSIPHSTHTHTRAESCVLRSYTQHTLQNANILTWYWRDTTLLTKTTLLNVYMPHSNIEWYGNPPSE